MTLNVLSNQLLYRRETFITNELMIRSEDLTQDYDDDEENPLDSDNALKLSEP